jgi:alpha-D-xyloside xylohydrolase
LLPYIYSASWDVTSRHGTMMRALAFDFREDAAALHVADEYMFGKALLVAPVVQKGAQVRTVYLPGRDAWYDFRNGRRSEGGTVVAASADIATIPVFVRAGSILSLGPVKAYADAPSDEPIEIRVYPGRDGSFELYDDAGDGYGYLRGQRAVVPMTWSDAARRLEIGARQGRYPGMSARQTFSVRCAIGSAPAQTVVYSGAATGLTLEGCR